MSDVKTPIETKSDTSVNKSLFIFLGCLLFAVVLSVCIVVTGAFIYQRLVSITDKVVSEIDDVSNSFNDQIDSLDDLANGEDLDEDAFGNSSTIEKKVSVAGVVWKVQEVKNLGSSLPSIYKKPAGFDQYGLTDDYGIYNSCDSKDGKFISVRYKVTNTTSKAITNSGAKIYDSEANQYTAATDITNCTSTSPAIFIKINPGLSEVFTEIYEVPKQKKGFKLEVTNLEFFDTQKQYIDLGL